MTTILSNGADISDLTTMQLAELVAKLRASLPTPAKATPKPKKAPKICRVSPHTGACIGCGAPAGTTIECDPLISQSIGADSRTRRMFL